MPTTITRKPYSEDRVQLIVISGPSGAIGKRLQTWTEYEYTEDLFTPANHFKFKLAISGAGTGVPSEKYIQNVMEYTQPDSVVKLELDGVLLGIGIIDTQEIMPGEDGQEYIEIEGMDPGMLLLANEVDPKLSISSDTTLPAIADTILKQYRGKGLDLEIVADDIANRSLLTGKIISSTKTIKTSRGQAEIQRGKYTPPTGFIKSELGDVRPHPGETEWAFLMRHAENLAVMPYFTADGDLTFIAPDYEQDELYLFSRYRNKPDRGSILSGGRRKSMASAATSVEVLGRGSLYRSPDPRVKTKHKRKTKPPIRGTSTATIPFTWPRRRHIRDMNPSNNEEAQRLANRELAHRNANCIAYEYVVAGHTNSAGYRYSVNTMAHIHDEVMRPTDDLSAYVTKRIVRKKTGGPNATTTAVTLVPKGAIIL